MERTRVEKEKEVSSTGVEKFTKMNVNKSLKTFIPQTEQ